MGYFENWLYDVIDLLHIITSKLTATKQEYLAKYADL